MRNIVIASLVAIVSTQASAQGISHYVTVPVTKSDVANGEPGRELRKRIVNAIDRVCGSHADVVNLEQFADNSRCRRAALADVERQLAKPSAEVRTAARTR